MSQLIVRQLLIDLETPIAVRWNGGDAGSFSLIGTIICRNDETGILMADRG